MFRKGSLRGGGGGGGGGGRRRRDSRDRFSRSRIGFIKAFAEAKVVMVRKPNLFNVLDVIPNFCWYCKKNK